jgi:alkylated DNA repair dioxygenase AlkB
MFDQGDLFGPSATRFPSGFRYEPEILSRAEESTLVEHIRELPFREFDFHGFLGKRRVVSFGWKYDFSARLLLRANDIPDFILPIRQQAASFAGMPAESLQQVLVTEYAAGAGIGWHRDKQEFGEIVGISLVSPCLFRLRRKIGEKWERVSVAAEARSAYLMSGASRSEWEHSIPAVESLRYSLTFRNLREDL